jgi:hypothetical protein
VTVDGRTLSVHNAQIHLDTVLGWSQDPVALSR